MEQQEEKGMEWKEGVGFVENLWQGREGKEGVERGRGEDDRKAKGRD
jgi:hypothetical protein